MIRSLLLRWAARHGVDICPGCLHEIDPFMCHCGERADFHFTWGHTPVPIGCTCHYQDHATRKGSLLGVVKAVWRGPGRPW
jgi:hypothetical protein